MEHIIRIHRPVLTEEERARRMKLIEEAAIQLIIAADQAKREKAKNFTKEAVVNG